MGDKVAEKQAPKVFQDEEVEVSVPEEVEGEAKGDDLVEINSPRNIKEIVGKIIVISRVRITPTLKDNDVMEISRIYGTVIDNDEDVKKIIEQGTINDVVKKIVSKYKEEEEFYSTSKGVALSLRNYVIPALNKGRVLAYVTTKKSKYPQDMVVLVSPFLAK